MQDDDYKPDIDQRTLDFLLQIEREKIYKYMSDNIMSILNGLEHVAKSQNF